MENAGRAVADAACKMVGAGARIAVLCGPGNNGGDGFVAARLLRERGYRVDVTLLGSFDALKGDAATMARRWTGPVTGPLSNPHPDLRGWDLIIDALFGAGLSRRIEDPAKSLIKAANSSGAPILAIDVPSGLDGTWGEVRGDVAIAATRTVTFFRRKVGHALLPGRALCGHVVVADIGITEDALEELWLSGYRDRVYANDPKLWLLDLPKLRPGANKYDRGHALVVSGPAHSTGAARLGARGALRIGAGLVSVATPPDALAINASQLTAIMVKPFEVPDGLAGVLHDKRINGVLIGPGCGIGLATRSMVLQALGSGAAVVLDADALTSFSDAAADLFAAIKKQPRRSVVVTPHEGEFQRLFGKFPYGTSKVERAREAARRSGAIVVLKGADTVIAGHRAEPEPCTFAAINENAPAWLATAGSGDVLAGFITGLLAQGMPAFEAACAAAWVHGECATRFGPGLIAEDLPETLPTVLASLRSLHGTAV
jgi:hydroxyethylthiazole kinase-like uncharacterized protein yjeF